MRVGMANQNLQPQRPKRVRVPSERARGLDPEITAQPHTISDVAPIGHREPGLSIDPEDLGNHFLSEAVEQGEPIERDDFELKLAMLGDPESDDRPSSEISVWTRMVDLATEGGGASEQLRDAAVFGADALDAERSSAPAELDSESEREEEDESEPIRLTDTAIRERSLLDREGPAQDEVLSPDIDADDTGHHARLTSREALGAQVRSRAERAAGGVKTRRSKLTAAASAQFRKAARKMRNFANKLTREARHY